MDAYLRSCGICGDPFLACRERGFNRQYCKDKCTGEARQESSRTAQTKNRKKTRSTPEGRERHNAEQRAYGLNKRRELAKSGKGKNVGDQLSQPIQAARMVVDMTCESPEPLSASASAVSPGVSAVSSPSAAQPSGPVAAPSAPAEVASAVPLQSAFVSWTVIAVPRLAVLAREWLESARVVRCACCKRAGRVTRVVEKNESPWTVTRRAQLRQRRGIG
jgi:hypothetical protein